MKRWIANTTVVVYLGALFWGIFAHAMSYGTGAHPAMYFVVWDMFCGFTSYEKRQHVIGEGQSGTFYELDPPPWGEVKPFGPVGRRNFDVSGAYSVKFAMNTLKHTRHEPINRIFVVEEFWAKKYNLPDGVWAKYYSEPKRPTKYHNVLYTVLSDGTAVDVRSSWLVQQFARTMASNPKLQIDSYRSQPFFHYNLDLAHRPDLPGTVPSLKPLLGQSAAPSGL